jgi:hypothetical protein
VAIAPNHTLEGGEIRLDSYRQRLSAIHADTVDYDPASGAFAISLQLPTVDAALGEYFEFDPTAVMGRFDPLGEAVVEVPVRMRDFRGNEFDMTVQLTTGVSTVVANHSMVAMIGRARGADGRATLVGMANFPGRTPFPGEVMRISLDVHLK